MSLTLMLALQASAPPQPPVVRLIDFDLARYRSSVAEPSGACADGDPNEVVVCGVRRRSGNYPLAEMERRYAARRIVAETRLTGNVMGDMHVEAVPMDRGAVSNRAMVRVRIPF